MYCFFFSLTRTLIRRGMSCSKDIIFYFPGSWQTDPLLSTKYSRRKKNPIRLIIQTYQYQYVTFSHHLLVTKRWEYEKRWKLPKSFFPYLCGINSMRVVFQCPWQPEIGNFTFQRAVHQYVSCRQISMYIFHVCQILHTSWDALQHVQ